jgi:hypothetical protein
MFFHFKVPPAPESTPEQVELNVDGEPMYLYGPGGELIINDPTLVKVVPDTPDEASKEPVQE